MVILEDAELGRTDIRESSVDADKETAQPMACERSPSGGAGMQTGPNLDIQCHFQSAETTLTVGQKYCFLFTHVESILRL